MLFGNNRFFKGSLKYKQNIKTPWFCEHFPVYIKSATRAKSCIESPLNIFCFETKLIYLQSERIETCTC